MKKLIFTLMLLMTFMGGALAQNDAMYIYRNDGQINAIPKTSVDSISYSHFDMDSLFHQEWQMQVVYTPNGLFRTSLSLIDSVSFSPLVQGVYPMSENDLQDWDEGYVLMNKTNVPSAYMLLQQDAATGEITMCLSEMKNTDVGKTVCAIFDSTGNLEVVTGEGKTGIVVVENGNEYMQIYDGAGQLLMKEKISGNQKIKRQMDYGRKGSLASDLVGIVIDGKGRINNFIDLAKIENRSDFSNLILNLGTDLAGTVTVFLSGLTGWGGVILGAAVGGLMDASYALIRKLLYGTCNTKITKVIVPEETGGSFKVGVNITDNASLDEGERKFFSVVGRSGNDRVDYTHKDYSTANYEVSRVSQPYYEIPLLQDLQVGHIHFVPYLQTEGGLSGGYNFIKEWTIKYGEKFEYVYPDPQILSCEQTGATETGNDIMVRLLVRASICSVKNVSKVCYELSSKTKSSSYVDVVAEGTQDVSGREYEFNITQKIDKKYFPKNNSGEFSLRVYAVGTNNGRGYSEEKTIKLGLQGCTDEHHPHAIDLGLPSGTKWACCNVGANSPEEYGGYYAWGEVAEKGVYNWDTYAYGSDWDDCQYIGSEISGTQYDVAHVQWGGSWRMPTLAQCEELMDCCTSSWTSVNGVNGRKFVGPNGNSIFLPAAGCRWDDYLNYAGSGGYYWSGTLNDSYDSGAYSLYADGSLYWYGSNRYYGRSVRPVCQ